MYMFPQQTVENSSRDGNIYIYTHTHTYIYIYNIFLIQTSTDDHLGCYHVLNIINSKAVNVGAHVSFQFSVTFF